MRARISPAQFELGDVIGSQTVDLPDYVTQENAPTVDGYDRTSISLCMTGQAVGCMTLTKIMHSSVETYYATGLSQSIILGSSTILLSLMYALPRQQG